MHKSSAQWAPPLNRSPRITLVQDSCFPFRSTYYEGLITYPFSKLILSVIIHCYPVTFTARSTNQDNHITTMVFKKKVSMVIWFLVWVSQNLYTNVFLRVGAGYMNLMHVGIFAPWMHECVVRLSPNYFCFLNKLHKSNHVFVAIHLQRASCFGAWLRGPVGERNWQGP